MHWVLAWFEETSGGISYCVSKAFISCVEFFKFVNYQMPLNWQLVEYYINDVRKVVKY